MTVMAVEDAATGVWLLLCAASVGVFVLPGLNFVSKHGKLQQQQEQQQERVGMGARLGQHATNSKNTASKSKNVFSASWQALQELKVPKHWFTHMYVLGLLIGLHVFAVNMNMNLQPAVAGGDVYMLPMLGECHIRTDSAASITLALINVQCMRRLFECHFVSDFGASTMHVSGYVVGMLHYFLVPLSFALASDNNELSASGTDAGVGVDTSAGAGGDSAYTVSLLQTTLTSTTVCTACIGFLLASWTQYTCHRELASCGKREKQHPGKSKSKSSSTPPSAPTTTTTTTTTNADNSTDTGNESTAAAKLRQGEKQYSMPQGWAFDLVCCPHYTSEIVLYFCLAAIDPSPPAIALFLWVFCNLCVVAGENMHWYQHHFKTEVVLKEKRTGRTWRRCVPFLW